MERRMDKYYKEDETKTRIEKNEYLYDDLNNKIGFEEVIDLDTKTKIDLSSINQRTLTREEYQQMKDYQKLVPKEEVIPSRKEICEEKKTFDINEVLEEARKNRGEVDELEKRRNLKNEEYNVLANLNKKYLHKKEPTEEEEGEIKELIDTITSKTLKNEVEERLQEENQDTEEELLSDLLETKTDITLEESLAKEILNEEDPKEDKEQEEENTFYTKSLELSEQDFELKEEIEKEGRLGRRILIAFVIFVLLALIIVMVYFVLNHLGVNILN